MATVAAQQQQAGKYAKLDINVEKWIKSNYTPYNGDSSFLASKASPRTSAVWSRCTELLGEERNKGGLLDVDWKTPGTITSHQPGYIDKDNEVVVGLQTDAPLKRAIKPFGGLGMVEGALKANGYPMDPTVKEIFSKYRKTHNEAVFDIYTSEMRAARSNHIVTGLPDGYGRGRIIGDYRRVALYGVDALISQKLIDKHDLGPVFTDENMVLREEIADQVKALKQLKEMAASYGFDLGRPAKDAREAVQWTYFAYLASVKDQDGAAMSFGRVDAFFDVYIQRDIEAGKMTEEEAQELIDQLVIKLRLVRHLRTPEYNELFAGDPTWVTMVLGGCTKDGKSMVTKTAYRILNTLYTLGPAPEPNLTVLWNDALPAPFKLFAAHTSIDTSSVQYESDSLMCERYGDDYAIACCVSAMTVGKDMQFFGARCNLAKLLLYVLNEGRDEITGKQVGPGWGALSSGEGPLNFDEVFAKYDKAMDWLAALYVNTMNAIHRSHDKYCYEAIQMALHDTKVRRLMAFGIAGLSVIADSLSAIKYAKVYPIRDPKTGLTVDFRIEGEFPKFGNDDDRVDAFAAEIPEVFHSKLQVNPTYRDAVHTLSVLTITSNVVYGNATGATPDGRKRGQPFAPGCNPMHGREFSGAIASLNSVAKVPYDACRDGISNTFTLVPSVLGHLPEERNANLAAILDGYFQQHAFHVNVNVLKRETLEDAMAHPENYPNLTIRVSGYAVNFVKLTPAQQREVISRTFHDHMA
ncbi:pyruvate formate lyase [Gonapodya prolifera JEL478]|uniref:formate C-acetyltransferase n=1 Tax=Gonapodya prolifera (strain JEL478) TaxID=1344416 RepID=A0A139A8W4_GONPJ|nr:pyruvate formate lyase [Gonapodya prolifera JEL478]|eukprot:KXS13119.1 pyruvate formate lyase [Gonapodya prolifera JEL478]